MPVFSAVFGCLQKYNSVEEKVRRDRFINTNRSKMPPSEDDGKKTSTGVLDERSWIENHVRVSFKIAEKELKKLIETDDYRFVSFVILYCKRS